MTGYRFLKISSFYPGFLRQYATKNDQIARRPYEEQYAHLMSQGFGWSDYYSRHLQTLGCEATEIVANATSMQKAWACERGLSLTGPELVLRQAEEFKPDVVFIQDTVNFNGAWADELRRKVPSVRLVLGWRCSPYNEADVQSFKHMDLIFTCNPRLRDEYIKRGIDSHVLHHGFEFQFLNYDKPQLGPEVLFAGSLMQGKGYHEGRLAFLARLAEADVPLEIYAESTSVSRQLAKKTIGSVARAVNASGLGGALVKNPLFARALGWDEIKPFDSKRAAMSRHWKAPRYGTELYSLMASAQMCLNFHIDSAGDYAGNSRLFEATGVGSCLVTDRKLNIKELFEPDSEVVVYSSAAECIEKLKWLTQHPKERAAIAAAGARRCRERHSYAARVQELHELIAQRL